MDKFRQPPQLPTLPAEPEVGEHVHDLASEQMMVNHAPSRLPLDQLPRIVEKTAGIAIVHLRNTSFDGLPQLCTTDIDAPPAGVPREWYMQLVAGAMTKRSTGPDKPHLIYLHNESVEMTEQAELLQSDTRQDQAVASGIIRLIFEVSTRDRPGRHAQIKGSRPNRHQRLRRRRQHTNRPEHPGSAA